MAESEGTGEGLSLPRWQVALAIGAPVAIGIAGFWYYRRRADGGKDDALGESGAGVTSKSGKAHAEETLPQAADQVSICISLLQQFNNYSLQKLTIVKGRGYFHCTVKITQKVIFTVQ